MDFNLYKKTATETAVDMLESCKKLNLSVDEMFPITICKITIINGIECRVTTKIEPTRA